MMMLGGNFQVSLSNLIYFFTFLLLKILVTTRILDNTHLYMEFEFAQDTKN